MVREDGAQGQRTRLEAARLISSLPDQFEGQLQQLLHDPDPEVVRSAIGAVGTLRKRKSVPFVIEHLGDAEQRDDAIDALLRFEESIVGTLRDYLADSSVSIEVRREIPSVLVRVRTPEAMHVLAANVLQSDNVLRYRIIAALNKLRERHRTVDVDTTLVETVLAAEIMGHYRSYQILASANGAPTDPLKQSMAEDLERIFRLMKILSPEHDLQSVYLSLQSKNPVTHANALEFLDNTLRPQLRSLLVPLIDGDVSESERVHLADRLLGVTVKTQKEAVTALMSADDPWLKSCAELWSHSG
jgi:HEAT repeat protein